MKKFHVLKCVNTLVNKSYYTVSTLNPVQFIAKTLSDIQQAKDMFRELTPFEEAFMMTNGRDVYVNIVDSYYTKDEADIRAYRLIRLYRTDSPNKGYNHTAVNPEDTRLRVRPTNRHYLVKVTNKVTGMQYFGVTKNLESYWTLLKNNARRLGIKSAASVYNVPVTRDMAIYGNENFTYEEVKSSASRDEMLHEKMLAVRKHNTYYPNGYNVLVPIN